MPFQSPTITSVLLWLLRTFVTTIFCVIVGFAAIKALDFITVDINEFRTKVTSA